MFDALSPQMFSFNSPIGACPECLGLGSTLEVEMERVVPDATKSLREGAIVTWGEQDDDGDSGTWGERYRAQILANYKISPDAPFKELTDDQRRVLLYGSGTDRIKISWQNKTGSQGSWYSKWEGAIPRLKRMLKQTNSDSVREHYLQFFGQQACSACKGEKLKPEFACRHGG